jgi:hypothetical protein
MSLSPEELAAVRAILAKATAADAPHTQPVVATPISQVAKKAPPAPAKRGHSLKDFPAGAKGKILYHGLLRDIIVMETNAPWVKIQLADNRGSGQGQSFNCKPGAIAHEDEVKLSTAHVPDATAHVAAVSDLKYPTAHPQITDTELDDYLEEC